MAEKSVVEYTSEIQAIKYLFLALLTSCTTNDTSNQKILLSGISFYDGSSKNFNKIPKKPIVGYTSGVYDLFHIGHLNLLKNAKGLCDKLIVGVTVDKLVEYKNKRSVIPFEERIEIVRNIKCVDAAIPQKDLDKYKMWKKLHFDMLFVGDDWYNTPNWKIYEEKFKKVGVKVIYFPYTKGTSSTLINETLQKLRNENFIQRIS